MTLACVVSSPSTVAHCMCFAPQSASCTAATSSLLKCSWKLSMASASGSVDTARSASSALGGGVVVAGSAVGGGGWTGPDCTVVAAVAHVVGVGGELSPDAAAVTPLATAAPTTSAAALMR